MNKSQLISILRTFNKKEWRDLGKWLQSPAHNQREDVILLHDYLSSNDRINSPDKLKKEGVYPHIFPKEVYNDAKIRQTIHFFTKALDEFLIFSEIQQDEIYSKTILTRVFRKRKIHKAFERTISSVRRLQEKSTFQNSHYLKNEYLINQEQYQYTVVNKSRTKPMNLQEVSDSLDITYFADKLRQSCHMLAHQTVYKMDYDVSIIDDILNHVENKGFIDIPAIAIYYYGYKAITNKENESYFYSLKEQIYNHGSFFSDFELQEIYLMAINYCINKSNSGNKIFTEELFELFDKGFKSNILIGNNTISAYTFKNAIGTGLKLRKYEWLEALIENYQQYLDEQHKSVIHYTKARLHFEKGEYDQAMELFIQFEYNDILLNLSAKTMLLKMYFEQDEFDALESLLESMRNYLVRKKVMGYHKSIYKNIISFTKKLLKVNPYNEAQIKKLKDEIEATSPLAEKDWLLRQIEKL